MREHRARARACVYIALVPNVRGAERAIEAGADELNLVMSASETHNLRQPAHDARAVVRAACRDVTRCARQAGAAVNISLSTAFGCPMEGDVRDGRGAATGRRFVGDWARPASRCATPPAWPTRRRWQPLCDGFARALAGAGTDPAFPQHARHGPGQCAGRA